MPLFYVQFQYRVKEEKTVSIKKAIQNKKAETLLFRLFAPPIIQSCSTISSLGDLLAL
jgi:hypothetical protein